MLESKEKRQQEASGNNNTYTCTSVKTSYGDSCWQSEANLISVSSELLTNMNSSELGEFQIYLQNIKAPHGSRSQEV